MKATWRDVTPLTDFDKNGWDYYITGTVEPEKFILGKKIYGKLGITVGLGAKVMCEYNCEHLCPNTPGTGPGSSGNVIDEASSVILV